MFGTDVAAMTGAVVVDVAVLVVETGAGAGVAVVGGTGAGGVTTGVVGAGVGGGVGYICASAQLENVTDRKMPNAALVKRNLNILKSPLGRWDGWKKKMESL